ncbi:MAG: aminopeptidase N [Actinomycetota bacterium]
MTTAGKDNLTRAEAQERAKVIGDVDYAIELDLRRGDVTFTSITKVTFTSPQPGASTFIDLDAVEVDEVTLNGRNLNITETPDARIPLEGLEANNELVIKATCEYSRTGTGLHRTVDPVDKRVYTYTQFEPFDAHRVFACFDQPDLKATFAFVVHVHEDWVVVSNTRPVSQTSEVWTFDATPKMSTYLAAVCSGPYQGVFDKTDVRGKVIELGWWCRQSLMSYLDADELFDITKAGFEFFCEKFDFPYMTDSYDQIFCPEYKFGAMENLGCVTYAESMIFRSKVTEAAREHRAEVILHEMSHMWFGDLVTMRWWNDLWLNESFAMYMAYLAKERATRFKNSWVSFADDEKTWAYRQDQLPTTHPIVADIPDVQATHLNFDGITYAKGASVLKQLVAWVGEEPFFTGLKRYFKKHQYASTELPDFLGPLAEESGRDLDAWSKEWLETAGVNSIRVEDGVIVQESDPRFEGLVRSHRMGFGFFKATSGGLKLAKDVEIDVVGERTALAGAIEADLVLPNHNDLAYCKIRFDDNSLRTLETGLRDLDDALGRTLCWGALWDMLRDAELPASRYLDIVLNNIGGETDVGVVQTLSASAAASVVTYGNPARVGEGRRKIAARAKANMDASDPASDFQLAFARSFISNARDEADIAFVRGLLDGTTSVEGLSVDTDIRWLIVMSLATAGAIDDSVISAELERDPTDQGERYAAGARAARPTPEAKEEAWERVTSDPEITLSMMRIIDASFRASDDDSLVEPYVQRYFDEVVPVWNRREFDLGIEFTRGMFPRVYSDEVIAKTDALLADDVPSPMRRILIESKDDTERVMRARRADS